VAEGSSAVTRVQAVAPAVDETHLDLADVRRRLRAIFIGSIGNLVEWYDFYAYAAFALFFAAAFFPAATPSSSS
jgi:MHS family alpha-ketoglutarate permease-like MFS transporter